MDTSSGATRNDILKSGRTCLTSWVNLTPFSFIAAAASSRLSVRQDTQKDSLEAEEASDIYQEIFGDNR